MILKELVRLLDGYGGKLCKMKHKKTQTEKGNQSRNNNLYRIYIKRLLDFIFALILLILSTPIIVIGCILIKLNSNGPAFFKQKRVGKDCKEITIYKLRTMKMETHDNNGRKLRDRERVT